MPSPRIAAQTSALALGAGRGLEGLINEAADTDHQRPRTTLRDTVEAGSDAIGQPIPFDPARARFSVAVSSGSRVGALIDRVDIAAGSDEWPGNQRPFEVVDVNGDGVFDPRERHDLDNDCRPDLSTTPTGVGPATARPDSGGTCSVQQ